MNKSILKIIAVIAFMVQVVLPIWWGTVFASFAYFWVEGIIEGGILGMEIVTDVDQTGNSMIDKCFLTDPCSFPTLLLGLFSIYSIIAIIVSIRSLFSKKSSTEIYTKKELIFLFINLITIILSLVLISINGGVIPRL